MFEWKTDFLKELGQIKASEQNCSYIQDLV